MSSSSHFLSFAALRTAHTALLRLYRDKGTCPQLLDDAEAFVTRGAATGSLIQSEDDRMGAQSLLDYWAAILSRAERPPTGAALVEFDAALVPVLPDSMCPYAGLEPFGESRRQLFFGRERVLNEMGAHLQEQRFLVVVGTLGSGKSSIVIGGLIPALKAGLIPGSNQWRYYSVMTPGTDPLASLARAVGAEGRTALTAEGVVSHVDAAGDGAVIVVDGFEELFSICATPEKRDAFADAILALVASPKRHIVIATMRSDFEAQIAAVPQLHEPFARAHFRLPPLSASELRDAILGPAEQVGLKFEDGLVDRLVKEILGEPAGLPLLQFTLVKLWDMRDRNRITLEAYRKIGGGRLALARTADELYDNLPTADQDTLKSILLLMARPAAGTEVVTSSISRSMLHASADAGSVDRVVEKLLASRIVRLIPSGGPGEERLEIAHEALLRNWPRLVEWLDEERVRTRRRVRLTTAAEQWRAHGQDKGALLRGSLLEEAKGYEDLTPFERSFVDASIASSEDAAAEQERIRTRELANAQALAAEQKRRADEQTLAAAALTKKNRWLTGLAALAAVLLLVAISGWIFADRARRVADSNQRSLESKQRTLNALRDGRGVVVEDEQPRVTTTEDRPDTAAGAPSPVPPPPVGAPTGAASPNVASPPPNMAAPPLNMPGVKTSEPAGSERPSARLATAPRESGIDPERLLSRIRLRAARRDTGRRIGDTELTAYAFTAWADGPKEVLDQIESIQYEFNHPTFREKVQTGRNRQTGFRVGYTGWGCLSLVTVTIRVRDESVTPPHVDFDMCAALETEEPRK